MESATVPPLAPEAVVEFRDANGALARWFCTPDHLDELAIGWWIGEGRGARGDAPTSLRVDTVAGRVTIDGPAPSDVGLPLPTGPVRAPGLAAGLAQPPEPLHRAYGVMFERADRRKRTGGIHTGALMQHGDVWCVREDVSRHCVVDKLVGRAVLDGRPLDRAVVLLTGRISGAIAAKLARADVAVGATMSIPTSLAASIASDAGVTLIGRARSADPHVYLP